MGGTVILVYSEVIEKVQAGIVSSELLTRVSCPCDGNMLGVAAAGRAQVVGRNGRESANSLFVSLGNVNAID